MKEVEAMLLRLTRYKTLAIAIQNGRDPDQIKLKRAIRRVEKRIGESNRSCKKAIWKQRLAVLQSFLGPTSQKLATQEYKIPA